MKGLIIAIVLFYITHNPSKLLDNPDQQAGILVTQRFNLKDNDCIVVTFNWKEKGKWLSRDLEIWICDNRLYGPYGIVNSHVLYDCVWRHKK